MYKYKADLFTFHEKVKQINVLDIPTVNKKNPYEAFQEWILDCYENGIPIYLFLILSFGKSFSILDFIFKSFGYGIGIKILEKIINILKRKWD